MGLWQKIKDKRSERKQEREAVELAQEEMNRAGRDEEPQQGEGLNEGDLSALKK
jgi:hypothetical protein